MVWYNGGSPLYDMVQRHNDSTVHGNTQEHIKTPEHVEKQHCSAPMRQPHDPLSQLLNDRDALLIAAVILILMHEKADKKLILALAFVLFS